MTGRAYESSARVYLYGLKEVWTGMGFDKGRKGDRGGRGRDKRDGVFAEENSSDRGGFADRGGFGGGPPRSYGGGYGGGGGGDRGGGGGYGGGGGGGGLRSGGGGGGGGGFRAVVPVAALAAECLPGRWRSQGSSNSSTRKKASASSFAMTAPGCVVHISAVEQAGLTDSPTQPLEFTLVDRGGAFQRPTFGSTAIRWKSPRARRRCIRRSLAVAAASAARWRSRRPQRSYRRESQRHGQVLNAMKGFASFSATTDSPMRSSTSRRSTRRNADAQRGRPAGVRDRSGSPRQIRRRNLSPAQYALFEREFARRYRRRAFPFGLARLD